MLLFSSWRRRSDECLQQTGPNYWRAGALWHTLTCVSLSGGVILHSTVPPLTPTSSLFGSLSISPFYISVEPTTWQWAQAVNGYFSFSKIVKLNVSFVWFFARQWWSHGSSALRPVKLQFYFYTVFEVKNWTLMFHPDNNVKNTSAVQLCRTGTLLSFPICPLNEKRPTFFGPSLQATFTIPPPPAVTIETHRWV